MRREAVAPPLWEAKAQGCERARAALVKRYEPLVKLTLQKRLLRAPERFHDDLLGAGYLALVKAVDRYDPEKGVKFESFAINVILGAMIEWLRTEDWTPRRVRDREKRGEPVTILQQVSLEAIVYQDSDRDDLTLLGQLSDWEDTPDRLVSMAWEERSLRSLVDSLPLRKRRLIRWYYWDEEPFWVIGRKLGLSESRVQQETCSCLSLLKVWLERTDAVSR